ncbi:hypothetical protein B296_00040813 [Ensete ventricosum]|uniref:Uncharacterized protein n=1 Tax=Ensete ventricosum TaxID=4639 RepID=A0A426YCV8_ENSVE|nr:hypothetical protein B296_00040813 [Ensete ventricosum]
MLSELPPYRPIIGPMPKLDLGFIFSATLDNLPASLSLLLANSLAPSWQALDSPGKLQMHSWLVLNCIARVGKPQRKHHMRSGN